jgi:C-terminal processing protease CtpA/Prc
MRGLKRCVQVVKLTPGGTGEVSGLILVGDKLRFVDGVDVTKITAAEFTDLIMGPNGSTVTLSFQKP